MAARKQTKPAKPKKSATPHKLNISSVLRAVDMNVYNYYRDSLDDEQRKEVTYYTLARFVSSISSESPIEVAQWYLGMTNDLLNVHANDLRKHPQLQWYLASMIGVGSMVRHQWIPTSSGKRIKAMPKLEQLVHQTNPTIKADELDLLKTINTADDFIDLAEQMAWTDSEIKALRTELNANKTSGGTKAKV